MGRGHAASQGACRTRTYHRRCVSAGRIDWTDPRLLRARHDPGGARAVAVGGNRQRCWIHRRSARVAVGTSARRLGALPRQRRANPRLTPRSRSTASPPVADARKDAAHSLLEGTRRPPHTSAASIGKAHLADAHRVRGRPRRHEPQLGEVSARLPGGQRHHRGRQLDRTASVAANARTDRWPSTSVVEILTFLVLPRIARTRETSRPHGKRLRSKQQTPTRRRPADDP